MYQPPRFPTFVYPTETNIERQEETPLESDQNKNTSEQTKTAPTMSSTQSSEGTIKHETYDNPDAYLDKGTRHMVDIKFHPSYG